MSVGIEDMRNLGPATARMLAEIDIHCDENLRSFGAAAAYHRLKFRFGRHVTIIALYAMEAALRGCDWRDRAVRLGRLRQNLIVMGVLAAIPGVALIAPGSLMFP